MDFFDDVFIPAELMPDNSVFKYDEQTWLWNYQGAELFLDKDEVRRSFLFA
jgi:DNA-directed RNA polymerase III subunit RPC8